MTFNGNGSTSGIMVAQNVPYDTSTALNENLFAKQFYNFLGWALTSDGPVVYEDQESVELTEAKALYAKWERGVRTIYLDQTNGNDANDGSSAGTAYKTFNTAIDNSVAGDTIVFVGNYDTSGDGNEIILCGKGVTLTSNDPLNPSTITGAIKLNAGKYYQGNPAMYAGTIQFDNLIMNLDGPIGWASSDGGGDWTCNDNLIITAEINLIISDCQITSSGATSTVRLKGFQNLNVTITGCTFTDSAPVAAKYAVDLGSNYTDVGDTKVVTINGSSFTNYARGISADGYSNITMDGNTFQMNESLSTNKPMVQTAYDAGNLSVSITDTTVVNPGERPQFMFHSTTECTVVSFVCDMNVRNESNNVAIHGDATITVPVGKAFVNEGTLVNNGTIIVNGSLVDNGTLTNNGEITVTVTFNANTGTGPMDVQNVPYNTATALTANAFTKEHYHFVGWALTADGAVAYADEAEVTLTEAKTLYAKWEIDSYAVTATINNGGSVTNNDQNVNYGADAAQMVFTPATGYHFVSYSIDGGAAVDLDPAAATWNYTFTNVTAAHSIAVTTAINSYTVTLTGDAGITGFQYKIDDAAEYTNYTVAFSINHGQKLVVNAVLADGYTFTQWAAGITANPYTINSVEGDITYNATSTLIPVITDWNITIGTHTNGTIYEGQVEATSFTIDKSQNAKVYVDGNEVIFYTGDDPTTNHLHVLSAAPGAGYAFVAWTGVQTASSITADLTVGATFGAAYTGILKANNETSTQLQQPILIGSPYDLPTKDEVTGMGFLYAPHTSVGFNTAADNSGTFFAFGATVTAEQLASIAVENTVTIYVVWSHTVTYDVAGGSAAAPAVAEVAAGPYTLATYDGTKAGFTFGGWNDGSKVYAAGAAYTMPYANVTFTAEWVAITHTVTYDVAGGSATAPTQAPVAEGGNFTVADYSGTKTGYTFGGWNDGTETYAAGAVYAVGTANVTLTAVWNPISYTIAFDANGGTGTTASVAATYDVDAVLTAVGFTRADYAFNGWATTATGTAVYGDRATVKNLTSTADATVTLYAIWTQIEKKDNTAEVTVDTDTVSDQAAEQLIDAAKDIKTAGTEEVTAEISATKTESVAVKSDYVKTAADNGINLTIATSKGSIELPSQALSNLNVGTGAIIKSEIKEIEVPPSYEGKIDADAVVYSITLTKDDVAYTNEFGTAFTFRLAYQPAAGVDTSKLKVQCLTGDGNVEDMDAYYEDGFMVVTSTHLSDYAIFEDSSDSPAKNQGLLLAVLLIAAIVAPIIVALFVFKKE